MPLFKSFGILILITIVGLGPAGAQKKAPAGSMEVGVAKIDITPYGPIRLSGYLRSGKRINESEGVLQQLWAKAIAFGSDAQSPSVLITVDLAGTQYGMISEIGKALSKKFSFNPTHLNICASHTHSGPDMGNSHNMYFNPVLPVDQVGRIALYLDSLKEKLIWVATEALKNRKPSKVYWGQGQVGFAMHRRVIKNGVWAGHGKVPGGPVDHTLPLMKITDLDGNIKALFVSYACHGTTLVDDINKTHGDWIGEAQRLMEAAHPGAMGLVAQGCGGDADPDSRNTLQAATANGQQISDEVTRLLQTPLQPLTEAPKVLSKTIQLPYHHVPDTKEFIELSKAGDAKGHNAEVFLDRKVRGIAIDSAMPYYLSCWSFGNKLAMVFMAGEVVAGYSLRLRNELGSERLWVNAYVNDVKAYIPTKKQLPEGGYEVEGNMYYYDHPFRFSELIEDKIINAVYGVLPASFKSKTAKAASH